MVFFINRITSVKRFPERCRREEQGREGEGGGRGGASGEKHGEAADGRSTEKSDRQRGRRGVNSESEKEGEGWKQRNSTGWRRAGGNFIVVFVAVVM